MKTLTMCEEVLKIEFHYQDIFVIGYKLIHLYNDLFM